MTDHVKDSLARAQQWASGNPWQALAWAATSLILWCLGTCYTAQVAASQDSLRLAVVDLTRSLTWPVAPCLLALCGAAPVWLRNLAAFPGAPPGLGRRALWLGVTIMSLSAAKAVSLWSGAVGLLPYLTLLWSPHATWALALASALWWYLPGKRAEPSPGSRGDWRIAWLLVVICAVLYGAYALHFCQVTMLHGDEAPYLSVTQSLLRDGDIDLTDNLTEKTQLEFHVRTFGVGKAPASPDGRYHSVHPVGLSALLMLPYALGLYLWANPRLTCALTMVLLSSGCAGLCFVWLRRIGISRVAALVATASMAASAPFFSFTNQLYPEVPALFVSLVVLVLLAHWQRPGGRYVRIGSLEPAILGVLTLALAGLCFLHPRLITLASALGVLVLLQAWYSPERRVSLAAIGASVALGIWALVAYNLTYSGDWLGPFLPGNAWDEDALRATTWVTSLPGQWVHERMGLGAISPVYFLAIPAIAHLAAQRDRRAAVVAALYASTVVINGLHPEWTFGFSYPARFFVCALPALVLGLGWFLEAARGRAVPLMVFAAALALSIDGTLTSVALPELGFTGRNLAERLLCRFYPWDTFFAEPGGGSFPWSEAGFWATSLGLLALSWWPAAGLHRGLRVCAPIAAALVPAIWTSTGASGPSLECSRHVAMVPVDPGEVARVTPRRERLHPSSVYRSTTGHDEDGLHVARQGVDGAGVLSAWRLATLREGMYSIAMKDVDLAGAEGLTQGHLLIRRRASVPAVGPWEERINLPLVVHGNAVRLEARFAQRRLQLGYALATFSGYGRLSVGGLEVTALPRPPRFVEETVQTIDLPHASPAPSPAVYGVLVENLPTGMYTAQFGFSGAMMGAVTERRPDPVVMAAYVGAVVGDEDAQARLADTWFSRRADRLWNDGQSVRPEFERVATPWSRIIPMVGDSAHRLDFHLGERGKVLMLAKYQGPHRLQLRSLEIIRQIRY